MTDIRKLWKVWAQANGLYTLWANMNDVNPYLLFVLYALDKQENMTQKKICDCTSLTKQTVNSVIRTLKNEGYITLLPGCEDRREKQVVVTEKGIAYYEEILTPLYELEQRVFNIMGNDRVQQMTDAITLFNLVFQKEMESQPK